MVVGHSCRLGKRKRRGWDYGEKAKVVVGKELLGMKGVKVRGLLHRLDFLVRTS